MFKYRKSGEAKKATEDRFDKKGEKAVRSDFRKHLICAVIGSCLAVVLTCGILWNRAQVVNARCVSVQEGIAEKVFRLHILANSDSDADQEVKLLVRDAVLEYMEKQCKLDGTKKHNSAMAEKLWAGAHLNELESVANRVLKQNGFAYRATAEVTRCQFPNRQYGDVIFPEGEYEALRIRLGRADGHNWWCVMYPNLCLIDKTCVAVSDEGKEELRRTLTDEEYAMVMNGKNLKIRWFFFAD